MIDSSGCHSCLHVPSLPVASSINVTQSGSNVTTDLKDKEEQKSACDIQPKVPISKISLY